MRENATHSLPYRLLGWYRASHGSLVAVATQHRATRRLCPYFDSLLSFARVHRS